MTSGRRAVVEVRMTLMTVSILAAYAGAVPLSSYTSGCCRGSRSQPWDGARCNQQLMAMSDWGLHAGSAQRVDVRVVVYFPLRVTRPAMGIAQLFGRDVPCTSALPC